MLIIGQKKWKLKIDYLLSNMESTGDLDNIVSKESCESNPDWEKRGYKEK